MSKRVIKNNQLQFLEKELHFLEASDVLSSEKAKEIRELYESEKNLSFTKILLYFGSILIGAGVLSFVASNWTEMGKIAKFIVIIGMMIGCYLAGYKMERSYPKTSRSLYYLGVIVFGAGIFLVGQMFHFGGDFQAAFLWWSLGILPLAWVLRDKWILLASSIFVFIYMLQEPFFIGDRIPIWVLLWIAAIYGINHQIGYSKKTGFITGVHLLLFIGIVFTYISHANEQYLYVLGVIYLGIGIFLVLSRKKIREEYVLLGYLVQGVAALRLSFAEVWPVDSIYIPFSILYLMFVFYLVKKGSLLSIIILCVMIFRFYLDISFDFLPKSFVFIIGGLLLLGFGFYFERQRKKGGNGHG